MTSSNININNSLQSSNNLIQRALERIYEIVVLMKQWKGWKGWKEWKGWKGGRGGGSKGFVALNNVISGWKEKGNGYFNGMMKEMNELRNKLLAYLLLLKVSVYLFVCMYGCM